MLGLPMRWRRQLAPPVVALAARCRREDRRELSEARLLMPMAAPRRRSDRCSRCVVPRSRRPGSRSRGGHDRSPIAPRLGVLGWRARGPGRLTCRPRRRSSRWVVARSLRSRSRSCARDRSPVGLLGGSAVSLAVAARWPRVPRERCSGWVGASSRSRAAMRRTVLPSRTAGPRRSRSRSGGPDGAFLQRGSSLSLGGC